jgi:hypothetical protein
MRHPVRPLDAVIAPDGRGAVAQRLEAAMGVIMADDDRAGAVEVEVIRPVQRVVAGVEMDPVRVGDPGAVAEALGLLGRVRCEEGGCSF